VKKGRHRRFEEARSLKRSSTESTGRCVECGAEPDDVHAKTKNGIDESGTRVTRKEEMKRSLGKKTN